jgi:hypothetical protein
LEILDEGLVVVLREFDTMEATIGLPLADIFAHNSRYHMLFGRKLLLLLQVTTRDYKPGEVGAYPVLWNQAEFYAQ